MSDLVRIKHADWLEEAKRRADRFRDVEFVCPSCGYVQSGADFAALGVPVETIRVVIGFSCIGRFHAPPAKDAFLGGPGPCNYTSGGLIRIAPVIVEMPEGKEIHVFDFAMDPLAAALPAAETATRPEGG